MYDIRRFLDFCLFENALQVTSDWFVSTNGQDITKRNNNGYLLLESDTLSIIYILNDGSESRIDFYGKTKGNEIKTSMIDSGGNTKEEGNYLDVDSSNVVSILRDFIKWSNTEEMEKYSKERMIMGFSKTIIAFYRTDYVDQTPVSYKAFVKTLQKLSNISLKKPNDKDGEILELIKKFISQTKNHITRKE
jgi:hypothetical protein